MYPNFLSVFGIQLYGIQFERVLWAAGLALMIWGIVSSVRLIKKKEVGEGLVQGVIVLAGALWFGYKLFSSTIGAANYSLVFKEEIVIHSYAVSILVGVILAVWIATRSGSRDGLSAGSIFNLCLALLIFGFLGARLAYVLFSAPDALTACVSPQKLGLESRDCFRFFKLWEGGLTFYGGVISGAIVLIAYKFMKKVSLLQIADILAPSLALAHAFGRIGCLAAGCCFGEVTTGKVGVVYGSKSFAFTELSKRMAEGDLTYAETLATGHTPLMHANQLYEVFGELVLFFILIVVLSKRKHFGKVFATWLVGYGFWRFFTELMRGDSERGYLFEMKITWLNSLVKVPENHASILSTSQVIALGMICVGVLVFLVARKSNVENRESSERG